MGTPRHTYHSRCNATYQSRSAQDIFRHWGLDAPRPRYGYSSQGRQSRIRNTPCNGQSRLLSRSDDDCRDTYRGTAYALPDIVSNKQLSSLARIPENGTRAGPDYVQNG